MSNKPLQFVYFAGEPLGRPVLEILLDHGLRPELVVTAPDRPRNRGQKLQENPVAAFARSHDLPVVQPTSLTDPTLCPQLTDRSWDVFVVVAYPKILPSWVIETPTHGAINLHPSLLPKYRGVSPIRSAIIEGDCTFGTSIMVLDNEMDHGPLLAQSTYTVPEADCPPDGVSLDTTLAKQGGELLAQILPTWCDGSITPVAQNHQEATYTTKFTRADGELTIDPHALPTGEEAIEALRKIRGLAGWPGTFFYYADKRIKIQSASITEDGALVIEEVLPEGKTSLPFTTWLQSVTN